MQKNDIINEFNSLSSDNKISIYERALIRQSEYSGYTREDCLVWAMGYLKSLNEYVKRPDYENWIKQFNVL